MAVQSDKCSTGKLVTKSCSSAGAGERSGPLSPMRTARWRPLLRICCFRASLHRNRLAIVALASCQVGKPSDTF